MADDRIRIVVEPDTTGFKQDLTSDLARIDAVMDVNVHADTRPATVEIQRWETKEQADPIKKPVTVDTTRARTMLTAFSAKASVPLTKVVNVSTAGAQKAFTQLGSVGKKTFSALGGAAKASGVGALLLLGTAAMAGKDELIEMNAVSLQTGAALEKAGVGAAITVKSIEDLSGAMLKKSGIDDQAVQSGINFMLQQQAIRDTLKKQPQLLDTMTLAATNLASSPAFKGNMAAASKALGKALADPEKGLGALSKAGVRFTEGEKDRIAAMIEAGDTAKAQAAILAKVESAAGGLAEARGESVQGQLDKLSESFAGAGAGILGAMLPSILKVGEAFQSAFSETGVITRFLGALSPLKDVFTTIKDSFAVAFSGFGEGTSVIDTLGAAMDKFAVFVKDNEDSIIAFALVVRDFATAAMPLVQAVFVKIVPVLKMFGLLVGGLVIGILTVATAAAKMYTKLWNWLPTFEEIGFWISDVIDWFKKLPDTIGKALDDAGNAISGWADSVGAWFAGIGASIKAFFVGIGATITAWVTSAKMWFVTLGNSISAAFTAMMTKIGSWITAVIGWFTGIGTAISAGMNMMKTKVAEAVTVVVGWFMRLGQRIVGILNQLVGFVKSVPGRIMNGLRIMATLVSTFFRSVWTKAVSVTRLIVEGLLVFVRAIPGRILAGIVSLGQLLYNSAAAAWNRFKSVTQILVNSVIIWLRGVPGRIAAQFVGLKDTLYQSGVDLLDGFLRGLNFVYDKIKKLISGITGWIDKHKGPIEFDRGLLVPHGKAILSGFQTGLESQWGSVKSWISERGGWIAGMFSQLGVGRVHDALGDLFSGNGTIEHALAVIDEESNGGMHPSSGLADTTAMANIIAKRFGVYITSLLRPGAVTTTGNRSQHADGMAADFSNGITTPQMDALAAWAYRLIGKAFKQVLYRTMTGGNHFNHVHIGWQAREKGGSVSRGGAYMVGEAGPEPFIPRSSGFILSNARLDQMLNVDRRLGAIERGRPRYDHPTGANVTQNVTINMPPINASDGQGWAMLTANRLTEMLRATAPTMAGGIA